MATNLKNDRVSLLAADQKLADGTKQLLSQFPSLPVAGQNMTPAQIEQIFLDRIATGNAAVAADDARKAAVQADRDQRKRTQAIVNAFKRIVIGMFLQSPDKLGLFGLQAPKVGKKTAATKATAAATANATKKARGPIGKLQRAKVKATPATAGSPQPATPATAAPAPAVTPAPSPTVTPEPAIAAPKAAS